MSPELDKKLCEKYPELFRDRHGDVTKTCMVWGFECGDGWYSLIESICEYLMADVNRLKARIGYQYYGEEYREEFKQQLIEAEKNIPVVAQVKEKFGGLRFYVHGATEEHYNYIEFAENFSYRICEECGTTHDVMTYNCGWMKTLCSQHADERYGRAVAEDFRKNINE